MTTYLEYFLCVMLLSCCCFLYCFMVCADVDLLKLSDHPFEVGGGALDFALVKKLM